MEKIAIDARYVGLSGIGRVDSGIIDAFVDAKNIGYKIILFGNSKSLQKYSPYFEIKNLTANPFSIKGLFLSRNIINLINSCDAFFTPNYLIPFGVNTKILITIHDCAFFDVDSLNKGTIDKMCKHFLYKRSIAKSNVIFTDSQFSKNRITALFKCDLSKIKVEPIGLSKEILNFRLKNACIVNGKKPFFLFIGNFKSHKGIDTLLQAFSIYRKKGGKNQLIIVGNKDNMKNSINIVATTDLIHIKESTCDQELYTLLSNASALIQPSRYEGFGLPPLEALYLGTNVILSDIQVFKENYPNRYVNYFRVNSPEDLAATMLKPKNKIKPSQKFFKRFNYLSYLKDILGEVQK
jgi:glycosyltransferase involved in cell wall biosynthesis